LIPENKKIKIKMKITAEFDKAELQKIYKNISKVKRVVKGLINTLPRDGSRQYSELVKNAIINGRSFAKYSPSYKAWKDRKGFGSKFWKLRGDLERVEEEDNRQDHFLGL
jgi:hypothetical protein